MAYPKFILTSDGRIRLGMVVLHRHLLEPGELCLGGGYWSINHAARQVELSGASSDYGKPQWSRVAKLLLPRDYEGYVFTWLTGGNHQPLSLLLPVEYV